MSYNDKHCNKHQRVYKELESPRRLTKNVPSMFQKGMLKFDLFSYLLENLNGAYAI